MNDFSHIHLQQNSDFSGVNTSNWTKQKKQNYLTRKRKHPQHKIQIKQQQKKTINKYNQIKIKNNGEY